MTAIKAPKVRDMVMCWVSEGPGGPVKRPGVVIAVHNTTDIDVIIFTDPAAFDPTLPLTTIMRLLPYGTPDRTDCWSWN